MECLQLPVQPPVQWLASNMERPMCPHVVQWQRESKALVGTSETPAGGRTLALIQ